MAGCQRWWPCKRHAILYGHRVKRQSNKRAGPTRFASADGAGSKPKPKIQTHDTTRVTIAGPEVLLFAWEATGSAAGSTLPLWFRGITPTSWLRARSGTRAMDDA